ncbi:ABC transporter substrate-binding protein [Aliarcobacter cryaerophilus]|uniref:ABC transporter substrate-binding protein n=1 Tax=Aliarcobacter cryaerophilus TaxID=28198 RepID=UPI0021B6828C|nr:ABC transporter substrate-binding protein [Aliarcobacter cryaerophilus]MCT7485542.1 ABC transporter substrate-binding protein [Aliarcobacter cryaerophilus]MCT7491371.1 ABC transporter substrate-binding protein [Aliarcobacter cryaerophilus]
MFKYLILTLSIFSYLNSSSNIIEKFEFRDDSSKQNIAPKLHPNSHINIFLPSLPYSYIAKATNSGLIRSYDNEQGFVYDLAKSHKRVDDFTYIFELRENLKFQNGENFTIDDAIYNLKFFEQNPYLYTNIDKVGFEVFKIDNTHLKIVLKQKYEMFLNDLANIYFYTKDYIKKYNPIGEETGTANQVAGAFGMGPYIITSGYALGSKQTQKIELKANPFYWNKEYPKIKQITVYTQLDINQAIEDITKFEGKLDLMPLPFNKKLDVITSEYSKVIISKSTDNFIIFFNLINGNEKLLKEDVRVALNEALNHENLLKFVYKNEGKASPFATSINYKVVENIVNSEEIPKKRFSKDEIKSILNGLTLEVFLQDRFLFLLKGIEYQLKEYGVKINYRVTTSEKDIYSQLLTTNSNKNSLKWDLLVWGDDDWYYENPWTVFFIYENDSAWSTIPKDELMQQYIHKFFITKTNSNEYKEVVKNILFRAKEKAYSLAVPSVNKVFAVNKEVIFKPYQGGIIPFWEIEISNNHWSIRKEKEYSKELKKPIKLERVSYD